MGRYLVFTCLATCLAAPATAAPAPAAPTTAAPTTAAPASPTPPSIAWRTDHEQAMRQARKEHRPVLIEFWATWCGPCKDMEARLWSRTDVVPLAAKFVCLRVDVDRQRGITERYHADSLPTVVITDPWETELARREGFGSPERYLALFRDMPADFSAIVPLEERLTAHPRDPQVLRDIGLAYQHMNLFDASTDFLQREIATVEARAKPDMLAEALTVIGWNSLRTGNLKRARKSFERCLREVPTHPALDVTVYGLFATNLMAGDRKGAEPLLARLESCCPDSAFLERARQELGAPDD